MREGCLCTHTYIPVGYAIETPGVVVQGGVCQIHHIYIHSVCTSQGGVSTQEEGPRHADPDE